MKSIYGNRRFEQVAREVRGPGQLNQFVERVKGTNYTQHEELLDTVVRGFWETMRDEGFDRQDVLDYVVSRTAQVLDEREQGELEAFYRVQEEIESDPRYEEVS